MQRQLLFSSHEITLSVLFGKIAAKKNIFRFAKSNGEIISPLRRRPRALPLEPANF